MEHVSLYLQKLKFDQKLKTGFIAKYLVNLRFVVLITLAIVLFGITSYFELPRKLNPEIKIPIVLIQTVLPGAGPKDVESLLSIPIEDAVRGVTNVKKVTSTSRDSVSIVNIEFLSGTDPEKAKSDIQSAVDGITNLPEEAVKPKVQKLDFENEPIWIFNLSGDGDKASLGRFAKKLKQDLEDLPSIDKVDITGLDTREVQIVIKPEAVSTYNINPQALIGSVKSALATFPAGNVRTVNSSFSLTIDPNASDVEGIRNIKLSLNGKIVSLSDIATVSELPKPDQNQSFILNSGKVSPSVSFYVYRLTSVNIDKADKEAKDLIDLKIQDGGSRFKVLTVQNAAEKITTSFVDLQRDMSITIGLVFLVLLAFLGIRQALVAMLSTPLTFLITFLVMKATGIALSFIATFSLLLSLGLLVDDTIVVISALTAYFRSRKFTPLETGLLVWRDFFIAILTTTITTVWAFLPLLLSTGIIGEFIKPIPIVVSSTLMGSIFVALFITMPFMIFLLKPSLPFRVKVLIRLIVFAVILEFFYLILPKSTIVYLELLALGFFVVVTYLIRQNLFSVYRHYFKNSSNHQKTSSFMKNSMEHGFVRFTRIEAAYLRLIQKILKNKKARIRAIVMVAIFSIFSYSLLPLGLVKSEFFPKTDEDSLYLSIEYPAGTNLTVSQNESIKVFESLKDLPETKFISLEEGRGFIGGQGISNADSNNVLFSVALNERKKRSVTSSFIAQEIRNKLVDYTKGKVSVIEVSGGPPAGADLQIKLFGPDLAVLDQYANKIEDYLSAQKGVTNIDKSIKPGTSKITFVPDNAKLSEKNISLDQIGLYLRTYASGIKADHIKLDQNSTHDEDITIRFGIGSQYVENVNSINIPTPSGLVPLSSLGHLELAPNPTLISREDAKRTLSVTAGVTKGFNVADLNKNLEKFAGTLNLPSGYGWATGGVNEENQKSVTSILQAMLLSFLLIVTTMVLQFSSFRKALIVMLVIPLSISGVFIIFALTQTPLSFPALIGILALFGIVVKNSILVVDKIIINNEAGMDFTESIADAASSRLEPIALTSICAIVGLIPITVTDPLWRGLGGAIIAGLTFSGTIMLFFIPVVYYLIYQPKNKV